MSPTSTTAFPSGSYPTSLTPRQHSPLSIFERHQQEILPINVPLPNSRRESEHGTEHLAPGATSLSTRASSACDADLIDEMEELGSPSSFHTAMDLISPTFGNIGLGVPLSPVPVTPKTSTSITSFMSDMSTLGPLATQQDIKDNEEREDRHLVAQRRKLEHMLGDSVVVGIDTESGGMKARCLAEPKGAESDMDDWEILADNGNTSKSKLERTLGQGADSAHVALNAEYRKRPGDSLDIERNSREEETTESAIVPLLKAIPASFKSMIEGQSTSSTTPARPSFPPASSESSSGKLVGSGSFTAVLQAGRKRFQSKQQGSSTPCRGRSSSPETVDASQCEREEREKMTDDDLKVVNDLDPVERKILLKRTRKLERVLGETLKEREVGQHVVQCHAGKCASTDANEREDAHCPRVSLDRTIQPRCSEESQTEAGLPRLSLKRASSVDMSPLDQVVKDADPRNAIPVNDGHLHAGSKEECTPREASLPHGPKTRARRYSSPISPGNDA
ncbi:hypothetical protein QFC21_004562 [Naganishia friedmannii]|uniref:Uncharacterized protein n=1 Tax=Naganishia friedmannii TaxID=89922 RepID=A0ACC2VGG2_9TREE|nr:hypothetical protein QFC21_004562 [Naganishia friedmannii]